MPRMPIHREPWHQDFIVLGPCPGCYLWTLEYQRFLLPPEELIEIVEDALQDHLEECPGLQEIVDSP